MTEFEQFEEFEQKPKKPLEIGEAINDTFEIYKKIALPGGLGLLIVMATVAFIAIAGVGFFVDIEKFSEEMKNFKPENLSVEANLIYVGALTLITALISPFIAGLLKMAHEADHNEEVKFSSIGYYINSSRFIHIVIAVAILTLFNTGINTFLSHSFPVFGNALALLITFPISILTFITLPLILFKELSFIEAINNSIQLTAPKFFIVVALLILAYILAFVGLIAFCIGIVFTMPIIYAMQYVIYKSLAD